MQKIILGFIFASLYFSTTHALTRIKLDGIPVSIMQESNVQMNFGKLFTFTKFPERTDFTIERVESNSGPSFYVLTATAHFMPMLGEEYPAGPESKHFTVEPDLDSPGLFWTSQLRPGKWEPKNLD
jgi:hypothetical protein